MTIDQLRGILLLREAEARERMEAETHRLARVETRLRHMEEEMMAEYEVVVKRVEAVRVIAASEEVADFAEIGPTEQRLFPRLEAALGNNGGQPAHGPDRDRDFTDGTLRVTTGLPVSDSTTISTADIATTEFRFSSGRPQP